MRIDKVTFDGKGSFTHVDAVTMNGNLDCVGLAPWRGHLLGKCGLHRNADHYGPGPSPICTCSLSSHQSGNAIHQLVIDPGFATTAEGERIKAPESRRIRITSFVESRPLSNRAEYITRPAYPLRSDNRRKIPISAH